MKYSLPVYVSCYRTDLNRQLRPTEFLNLAQDAATRAASFGNFSDKVLKTRGGVWIVARMQVRFLRPVMLAEELRLDTWHKGLQGVNFIRDYQLVDSSGQPVINSTSSWVIMDIANRCLLRDAEALALVPASSQCGDSAIEDTCPKVVLPKSCELELVDEHIVKWSDVDYNGHANNVKYSVWALDALPADFVRTHFLKELSINFNKEVPPGSKVLLYHAFDGGYHYIEGRVEDHQAFIVRLEFEE